MYCFIIDSNGTPLNNFSIASPAQKGFKIYPNPARDALRFELSTGQATTHYRILDMQGKALMEGNVFIGNPVSVSALPPASYILQVQESDKVWHASLFMKE